VRRELEAGRLSKRAGAHAQPVVLLLGLKALPLAVARRACRSAWLATGLESLNSARCSMNL